MEMKNMLRTQTKNTDTSRCKSNRQRKLIVTKCNIIINNNCKTSGTLIATTRQTKIARALALAYTNTGEPGRNRGLLGCPYATHTSQRAIGPFGTVLFARPLKARRRTLFEATSIYWKWVC